MFRRSSRRFAVASLLATAIVAGVSTVSGYAAPNDCNSQLSMAATEWQYALPGVEREQAGNLLAAAMRAQESGNEADCQSQVGEALYILTKIDGRGPAAYNVRTEQQRLMEEHLDHD